MSEQQTKRMVDRIDAGELRPAERMANGWRKLEGRISRVGIQVYRDINGTERRELRLPEDVFDAQSIASFDRVPVTNQHPSMLLDSRTARSFIVGSIGLPHQDGETFLAAPMTIYDEEANVALDNGRSQLSCGYSCELDERPGDHPTFGRYDAIQRNIRGNHVALVDVARGGPELRVRLDGSGMEVLPSEVSTTPHEDKTMAQMNQTPKLKIDGVDYEMTEGNIAAIQSAIERRDSASKTEIEGLKGKVTDGEKKIAAARAAWAKIKARRDGMKARMVACDECGGLGKFKAADGAEKNCDYCDGKGSFRLHEKYPDLVEGEEGEEGEEEDKKDITEWAVEQQNEEAAAAAHKDGVEKAKARHTKARKDRADSFARRLERAMAEKVGQAQARANLEAEARKLMGAEGQKFDGMDEQAIKRSVVAFLKPSVKLDGKTPEQIAERYAAIVDDVAMAQASQPSRTEAALAAVRPTADGAPSSTPVPAPAQGGRFDARDSYAKRQAEAWKTPNVKTEPAKK